MGLVFYLYHVGYLWVCVSDYLTMYFTLVVYVGIFMTVWTYVKTVLTEPGGIPFHFDLALESSKAVLKKGEYGAERLHAVASYCEKCERTRPVRTHHCSICRKCVMRMEHHCPWVGNCIGIHNYHSFTQFLVYSFILTSTIAGRSLSLIINSIEKSSFSTYLSAMVNGGLMVTLGSLVIYHLAMITINTNTIELSYYKHDNLFDFGWKKNFIQVFGEQWISWIFPVNTHCIGTIFPVKIQNISGETDCFQDKILVSEII